MARPSLQTRARTRIDTSSTTRPTPLLAHKPSTTASTSTRPTKQTKRSTKHATLLSRARASANAATGRSAGGVTKRRRPAKKLTATEPRSLGALAAALDDAARERSDPSGPVASAASRPTAGLTPGLEIKSRRGVERKKEMVNRLERERFARNLAVMSAIPEEPARNHAVKSTKPSSSTADRWAALRTHIAANVGKT